MSYFEHMRVSLVPFLLSRIVPFSGISFVLALVAHKSAAGLVLFSYVLAFFSVVSALVSMLLGAVGNLSAEVAIDELRSRLLFRNGLTLAFGFGVLAGLLCVMLVPVIKLFFGSQLIGAEKVGVLSVVYICAVPLLVVNTFLHVFHESSGSAKICALVRFCVVLFSCVYVLVAYFAVSAEDFYLWGMGYFALSECLFLLCLVLFSRARGFDFYPGFCRRVVRRILVLGTPIAIGLAGQKVYFYLLNEKLAVLATTLVAQLAVFMSVIGLLMVPVLACVQAHSLYVSAHPLVRSDAYLKALIGLTGLMAFIVFGVWMFGRDLFFLLGGDVVAFDVSACLTVSVFLISGALLALNAAHLRGLNDTLAPQLIMNSIMLCMLLPAIYLSRVDSLDINFYLRLQSAGSFVGCLLMMIRIKQKHAWPNPITVNGA